MSTRARSRAVEGRGCGAHGEAEAADKADLPDGMSIPDELPRREERLKKIAEARTKIEGARRAFRTGASRVSGQTGSPRGQDQDDRQETRRQAAQPPVEGPLPTDQINLTDEELRIMPVSGGGFEQCYNAQAVVAEGSLLVVVATSSKPPTTSNSLT